MVKVGDTIRIIAMSGEPQYNGKVGKVINISVDPWGDTAIHGTWGGCSLYPNIDEFEIINED